MLTSDQFLSSRPSTPIPFRPKRTNGDSLSSIDFSPLRSSERAEDSTSANMVAKLEKTAEATESKESVINSDAAVEKKENNDFLSVNGEVTSKQEKEVVDPTAGVA